MRPDSLFNEEKTRLYQALGNLTEGGIIERLEPLVVDDPSLELVLSIWPYPLPTRALRGLERLGYRLEETNETQQTLQHLCRPKTLQLFEAGADAWMDTLIQRDYRQAHPQAEADLKRAQAWWLEQQAFQPAKTVVQELEAFPHPWLISSGWAIDLFLGNVTRVHHDVDVVIRRQDQLELQRYLTGRGWRFVTPYRGRLEPWPEAMQLDGERHQVHAHREGAFIDFLLTDMRDGLWYYRRNPAVLRTLDKAILRSKDGIPYLAPELVLLFKSRGTGKERTKDQQDYGRVKEHLSVEQRAFLRWGLTVLEPHHPWLANL